MTTDQPGGKGPPSPITLAFSFLTHILLVAPVLYIIILAFSNYKLFSWHPICMSLGAGLLIMEAVFSISGEAFLSFKLTRRSRVTAHWILHTVGLSLMAIGFIIIIANKIRMNKYHFTSTHGQLGLATIVITVLVAAFGVLANNTSWIYPHVRPIIVKILHAIGGICVSILLIATLINGTYSHWWPGCDVGRSLVFASFFIAGFLVLVKPILAAVSRSKVVFGPPSSDT